MHHYLGSFLEAYIVPATFIMGGRVQAFIKNSGNDSFKKGLISILISVRSRCVYGLLK
jgi:hypothetical protein